MKRNILDLYSDYLISSFGPTTATGLAELMAGAISHDQVSRMLSSPKMTSKEWWRLVKPQVRQIERADGVISWMFPSLRNPTRMKMRSFVGILTIQRTIPSKGSTF